MFIDGLQKSWIHGRALHQKDSVSGFLYRGSREFTTVDAGKYRVRDLQEPRKES